jgi:DNA helicase-2/ATP-dependent DNA helicase PcrA
VPVASPERYLADLNPAQREAVLTTEGPLLVIAGAGSGKTRVLTYRVAHLLATQGVKPNEILASRSRTRRGEMRERLERMLGGVARAIWILTFHAACGRIFRREAQRLGYRSTFTIYDQADQVRLVKQCLEELERDPKRFTPRGIHSVISREKNNLVGPVQFRERVSSFYDQTVADVYELYQSKLFASNAVDFDDLLYLTVDVLERFPDALERWRKASDTSVDEYQTRTMRSTGCCSCRLSTATSALSATQISRLRVPRGRHPQHFRLERDFDADDRARAELLLRRTRSSARRTR